MRAKPAVVKDTPSLLMTLGYRAISALVDGGRLGENAPALFQPLGAKVISDRAPRDGLAQMKKLALISAPVNQLAFWFPPEIQLGAPSCANGEPNRGTFL
jgi:hypothetical protein